MSFSLVYFVNSRGKGEVECVTNPRAINFWERAVTVRHYNLDRITSKVRARQARYLEYVRRVTLVNCPSLIADEIPRVRVWHACAVLFERNQLRQFKRRSFFRWCSRSGSRVVSSRTSRTNASVNWGGRDRCSACHAWCRASRAYRCSFFPARSSSALVS